MEELGTGRALGAYRRGVLAELTEAYYLDEEEDGSGFHEDGIRHHHSRSFGVTPLAAWNRGPFMVLYQTDFRNGVAVLNRMLNHAALVRAHTLASLDQHGAPCLAAYCPSPTQRSESVGCPPSVLTQWPQSARSCPRPASGSRAPGFPGHARELPSNLRWPGRRVRLNLDQVTGVSERRAEKVLRKLPGPGAATAGGVIPMPATVAAALREHLRCCPPGPAGLLFHHPRRECTQPGDARSPALRWACQLSSSAAAAPKASAPLPITLAAFWWWYPVGSVALVAPAL